MQLRYFLPTTKHTPSIDPRQRSATLVPRHIYTTPKRTEPHIARSTSNKAYRRRARVIIPCQKQYTFLNIVILCFCSPVALSLQYIRDCCSLHFSLFLISKTILPWHLVQIQIQNSLTLAPGNTQQYPCAFAGSMNPER